MVSRSVTGTEVFGRGRGRGRGRGLVGFVLYASLSLVAGALSCGPVVVLCRAVAGR
jgi:hypothetical protein